MKISLRQDETAMPERREEQDPNDFSLVLGGPLYQLFRRFRVGGNTVGQLRRRISAIVLVAWLPLLGLSLADGVALGSSVAVPFVFDIDAHVRFLVALPLLVAAELIVHRRMRAVRAQFYSQGLVPASLSADFEAIVARAMKLRNSVWPEVLLLVIVYVVGILFVWRHVVALDVPTWYAVPEGSGLRPRLAGWWYLLVSLPVVQFILLRWYLRIFIWTRFLWQVSRLPLAYAPLHPDAMGGIGFLSRIPHAFAPLLLAQGTLLAGTLAGKILFAGDALLSFKLEIAAFVAVLVLVVLAPLLVFVLPLDIAKRSFLRVYGEFARRYVDDFEAKWLRGRLPEGEALLGNPDFQSLADLSSSFDTARGMSVILITRATVIRLLVISLLPLAPLLLTIISLDELLKRLLLVVF